MSKLQVNFSKDAAKDNPLLQLNVAEITEVIDAYIRLDIGIARIKSYAHEEAKKLYILDRSKSVSDIEQTLMSALIDDSNFQNELQILFKALYGIKTEDNLSDSSSDLESNNLSHAGSVNLDINNESYDFENSIVEEGGLQVVQECANNELLEDKIYHYMLNNETAAECETNISGQESALN